MEKFEFRKLYTVYNPLRRSVTKSNYTGMILPVHDVDNVDGPTFLMQSYQNHTSMYIKVPSKLLTQ